MRSIHEHQTFTPATETSETSVDPSEDVDDDKCTSALNQVPKSTKHGNKVSPEAALAQEAQIISSIDPRAKTDRAIYDQVVRIIKKDRIANYTRWSDSSTQKNFRAWALVTEEEKAQPPLPMLLAILASRKVLKHKKDDWFDALILERDVQSWMDEVLDGPARTKLLPPPQRSQSGKDMGPSKKRSKESSGTDTKVKLEDCDLKSLCMPRTTFAPLPNNSGQAVKVSNMNAPYQTWPIRASIEHDGHSSQAHENKKRSHPSLPINSDESSRKRTKSSVGAPFPPPRPAIYTQQGTQTENIWNDEAAERLIRAIQPTLEQATKTQMKETKECLQELPKTEAFQAILKEAIQLAVAEEMARLRETDVRSARATDLAVARRALATFADDQYAFPRPHGTYAAPTAARAREPRGGYDGFGDERAYPGVWSSWPR